ncbi:MAG: RluA family pseudouridine synthase, partial [Leptospiraceae bacterium]|nr:RluA family pseudouridine synthase [Leptospiraceae bacterium]
MVFKFIIPEKFDGSKLINVLLNNFNYLNQKEWEKEILNNNLLLNSQFTNPESIVKKNDIIEFTPANFIEPPVDFNYKILYEDDFFYAIGKSGDIPIHPSGRYKNNTLLTKL